MCMEREDAIARSVVALLFVSTEKLSTTVKIAEELEFVSTVS